jgi:hypothetical protein
MLDLKKSFCAPSQVSFCKRIAACSIAIPFLVFSARFAGAQTVATYTFADGTADGWTAFNGAGTPVASNAVAYAGSSYSLLTTTSAGGSGGPSISLNGVLQAGAQYTITGWVQLAAGESAGSANFTIRRSDPSCSGGTCYDTVGAYQVAVSASGWVQIGGSYAVCATGGGDERAILLSGRCGDHRDSAASRRHSDRELHLFGWGTGRLGAVWTGNPHERRTAGDGSEWRYQ